MDDIKVSVCLITYNHERYIAQSVESVLAQQTNFPIEIVIGEDCSTDSTRSIVAELGRQNPEKIKLRLAEQNQGGKANFMGTFAACRGKYMAMLEGDDYWLSPNKLQMQVDALDARPDWAICFHPAQCIWEDGMQGQSVHPLDWNRAEATIFDLFGANFIPTSSAVFRHRLFGELPPWFRELKVGDWALHILNAAHGNIGFLPDVMSTYRFHQGGVWTRETPAARMIAIFQMLTAIDHHFGGKYAEMIDLYRLRSIREVMAELDAAKSSHAGLATELAQSRLEGENQAKHAEEDLLTMQQYFRYLSDDFVALERKHKCQSDDLVSLEHQHDTLWQEHKALQESYTELHRDLTAFYQEEHRELKSFYDTWSKSIAYRVAQKTPRPIINLLSHVRRPSTGPDQPQLPSAASDSKVA